MTKEIVSGERLGFNNLSQDLRDVFVQGLKKDSEGKFRRVLSAMASDSEKVVMTDNGGRFRPESNEETFGKLVSLTAEAALYEADGKDTHSQNYFDLIHKTDVELTNRLNAIWADRERSVEIGDSRVVAKAWGKTSLEKIPSQVEELLEKSVQWIDASLIDKLISAYDSNVKKASVGLGVGTSITMLLTACNAPVAEVQEINQEISKPAVVDRQLLNSDDFKGKATQEDMAKTVRLLDRVGEIGKNYEGYVSGSETVIAATGENGNEFVWGLFKANNENGDSVWFVGQGVEGASIGEVGAGEIGSPLLRVLSPDGSTVLGYRDQNNELQPVARKFADGRYIYFSPSQDTLYEGNLGNDSEYQNLESRFGFWQVTTVHAEAIDPTTGMPTQIEPTAEPTVAATEVVDNEKLQKEEIAKNINEFLNSEGKFSLESFQQNSQYFFGESDLKDGELPLGMVKRWFGQFVLLGSQYDDESNVMHLYLGATDINKNRVAFDFNFEKNLDRTVEPPIGLLAIKSSLYSMSAGDAPLGMLDGRSDWNSFLDENMFKPISLSLMTESYAEIKKNFGKKPDKWVYGYDNAMDYRIALYTQLGKYGEAVDYNPEKVLDSGTISENLKCFWTLENFNGVDSLNTVDCPSNNYLFEVVVRQP